MLLGEHGFCSTWLAIQQHYVNRPGMASVKGIGEFEPPSVALVAS